MPRDLSLPPPCFCKLCRVDVDCASGLRAASVLWQPRPAGSACTRCGALAPAAFAPAPSQVAQEELESEVKRFGPTFNVWVAKNPAGFAFVVRPLAPSASLLVLATRASLALVCPRRHVLAAAVPSPPPPPPPPPPPRAISQICPPPLAPAAYMHPSPLAPEASPPPGTSSTPSTQPPPPSPPPSPPPPSPPPSPPPPSPPPSPPPPSQPPSPPPPSPGRSSSP